MKVLIIIALHLLTAISFGQSFTIVELIKINDYQFDEFDTYVTTKGYKYYQNDDNNIANVISYAFNTNKQPTSYISTFQFKNEAKRMVSYQTMSADIYLKIKNELKTLGFKFIETKTHNGSTFLEYKKENISVSLASKINSGNDLTSYEISVCKEI